MFFVLSRQNSSQRRQSSRSVLAVRTYIGNLASEGKNNDFCSFDAFHSLLKLTGFILDSQGYYKVKTLFSFSNLNFKYWVLKDF